MRTEWSEIRRPAVGDVVILAQHDSCRVQLLRPFSEHQGLLFQGNYQLLKIGIADLYLIVKVLKKEVQNIQQHIYIRIYLYCT